MWSHAAQQRADLELFPRLELGISPGQPRTSSANGKIKMRGETMSDIHVLYLCARPRNNTTPIIVPRGGSSGNAIHFCVRYETCSPVMASRLTIARLGNFEASSRLSSRTELHNFFARSFAAPWKLFASGNWIKFRGSLVDPRRRRTRRSSGRSRAPSGAEVSSASSSFSSSSLPPPSHSGKARPLFQGEGCFFVKRAVFCIAKVARGMLRRGASRYSAWMNKTARDDAQGGLIWTLKKDANRFGNPRRTKQTYLFESERRLAAVKPKRNVKCFTTNRGSFVLPLPPIDIKGVFARWSLRGETLADPNGTSFILSLRVLDIMHFVGRESTVQGPEIRCSKTTSSSTVAENLSRRPSFALIISLRWQ